MSVELQKLRGELMREALLKGWTRPTEVPTPWTTLVPAARLERWYRRLYTAPDAPLPIGGRLCNHFTLGADPEFVFHDGTQRVDARTRGLKAGPAFGADNNARLVELRPAPSRSALSVLASLWLSLRWMAVFHPQTLQLSWRSGAYFASDGLGGHIHFGRKRLKFREREVANLDRITHLSFVAGIFDREEGRLRVRQAQGAPVGEPYGALSDTRHQAHGYEYRTLPSWMDNPWLAYFQLVVGKLVVAFPDLLPPLTQEDANLSPEQARSQLRFLLAYYAPLDDDARLAHTLLAKRGFPMHAGGLDIKSNWGIFHGGPFGNKQECAAPDVFPALIPPREMDEQELALSIYENRAPELTPLEPTWQPHSLPQGYIHLIRSVDTKVAPGLGEWAMDLCYHANQPLNVYNMGHNKRQIAFRFSSHFDRGLKRVPGFRLKLPWDCAISDSWTICLNATKEFSPEELLADRSAIVRSGVFPLWFIDEVKPESFQVWKAQQTSPPTQSKGAKLEFTTHPLF